MEGEEEVTPLTKTLLDIMRYIPRSRLGFEPTETDAIEVARLSGLTGKERGDEFRENVRKITLAIREHRRVRKGGGSQ